MIALAHQSWPQVQEALQSGHKTVLFAAGAIEQHGPHLPLATDTLIGDALADRVSARLPGVLRGPTLSLGVSPHHMGFPGTISLTPETFKAVVREYVGSLGAHGFEAVLVIPSHGGNFGPLRELHDETGGEIAGARFVPFTDVLEFVEAMAVVGRADQVPSEVRGSHAGEAETSTLLALAPALVAMERAVAGYDKPLDEEAAARLFEFGTKALSEVGVLGDARAATADRGERYVGALVELLVAYFGQALGDQAGGAASSG